ncbi:MAG: hypothetical protein CSB01_04155, partial [Bacteroidia bacterium]
NFAMSIERNNLPADYYATYLEKLDKVTLDDITAMANKYVDPNNAVYLIVGDKQYKNRLAKLSSNGKVEEYDYKGDLVKETANAIPAGLTGEKVIENYIKAIGGADKWNAIKDMKMKATMTMGQMTVNVERYNKGEKFAIKTLMGGQVMQATIYNGKTAKVSQMGQTQEIKDAALLEGVKEQGLLCPELSLKERGSKIKLVGVDNVDGKPAYKVQIVNAKGLTSYDYFCIKSGLKIKSSAQQKGMVVSVLYKDYKEVDGVKIPFEIVTQMGAQTIPTKVTSYEINKGVEDKVFE